MENSDRLLASHGLTDNQDRLLSADDPLADIHLRCGGSIPGAIAIPELLDLVNQARIYGLKLARDFEVYDGQDLVSGFVRVHPQSEDVGGGCEILVENLKRTPLAIEDERVTSDRLNLIDRNTAEIAARLDRQQHLQFLFSEAKDGLGLKEAVEQEPGLNWANYVALEGVSHQQPLHWRLLDGARCTLPGSKRNWRARLLPLGNTIETPQGFELLLIADEPLTRAGEAEKLSKMDEQNHMRLIGSSLAPALRQPIARVVANAETIKSKLAGPLRQEYADYAGNIASAGQHLHVMLEDLADLEVVEAEGFSTAREKVDLIDAAERAAGILGVRAQARQISLTLPEQSKDSAAIGEFRRVLQILINLIGNAIAYSPEGSEVAISVESALNGKVSISVADQGDGISEDDAQRIFTKFERLGRNQDDGSGLGLYISQRLANAMEGDLSVSHVPDGGAQFILTLPAAG
ncbi:MAG: HAMP domain-containing sensor histidine kinase [Erythrobacter sp.]